MPVPMRSLPPDGPVSHGASALRTSLPVRRTQRWMPVSRQIEIKECNTPANPEGGAALSCAAVPAGLAEERIPSYSVTGFRATLAPRFAAVSAVLTASPRNHRQFDARAVFRIVINAQVRHANCGRSYFRLARLQVSRKMQRKRRKSGCGCGGRHENETKWACDD